MNLLSPLIGKYLRSKDTGLLSIKIEGESYLLKICFDSGEIVSLSLGACKNEECLRRLDGVVPVEHSFLPGMKPTTPAKAPLTEKVIAIVGTAGSETVAEPAPSRPAVAVQPQTVKALEEEFIELIGPIGKMLSDTVFAGLSYSRGNLMPLEDYSRLVDSLAKELPDQHQAPFVAKHRKG